LGGMLFAGVPLTAAIPLLAVEVVSYSVVVAVAACVAGLFYAPGWWRKVGPAIIDSVQWALPWIGVVVAGSVLVWWLVRRRRAARGKRPKHPIEWSAARGALGWPLAASVPLTLLSVACRVAVLPVLAQTLPAPPALPVLAVSSFALIYGQLFLPTPGGAGAIELAFSSGAAGDLGGSLGTVFLVWRACTTGLPVLLGLGLAIPRYGMAAVRLALRGRHS
ncbi:MAG: flippase-like domain-containing protein, partial [Gemmatimonadetes bacterium]|nr:flippase-like domain-containing protein [Gemmatimonadota bacterium]